MAMADAMNLSAALEAYYNEYGRYPLAQPNGLYLDEAAQAKLLSILRGQDIAANPHKIVFFEHRTAQSEGGWLKRKRYVGGVSPGSGALLDPWGNPYRSALDADYDGRVQSPYSDDDAIKAGVLVWSLGRDGQQSARRKFGNEPADDLGSWF